MSGVWQNPYQSEQVFMLSPPVDFYQGQSLQILLPANLWFTNNAAGITSIQLNAGDGAGYRTLTVGLPLTINYSDTGRKEWTYKLTTSGGSILYSHSQIVIQTDYTPGTTTPTPPSEVFPPSPFTATKLYLGVAGKAYATIRYANADHILRRPLIVAEGFDPGIILAPEERFGLNSLQDFLRDATNDGSNLTNLLSTPTQQYDIIYVDWKNGVDYLQRNAFVLETIIQWVNANKQSVNGVYIPNVVLGQSMGGVIARYALKDMENTGLDHKTRLYISDDAPHQGANVPQGYQHLARHARTLYFRAGGIATLIEIIQLIRGGVSPLAALSLADQPASKQMLINFVNGSNNIDNSVHNTWQTELKNLGYPNGFTGTPFRKVAVSNGSECATPQEFNPGANLLTYYGKGNTRVLGDLAGIWLIPTAGALLGQPLSLLGVIPGRNDFILDFAVNAQADGISNQVYKGKITYTKKILWVIPLTVNLTNRSYNSSSATFPYDYFPGGFYLIDRDLNNSSIQNVFFKYNVVANNKRTFNFVPTVSALDIGSNNVTLTKTDYLTKYIGATPPAAPKNTPFQNFITANFIGKVNEQHISINRRNGDWIAAELNSNPQIANCNELCSNITISGSPSMCAPTTYSVSGYSGTATYLWSSQPQGIVSITPTGNGSQATISKIQNGNTTISVTILSNCGGSFTASLPIVVGPPTVSISYSMSGSCHSGYQTWSLNASSPSTVTSWLWTVDNPSSGNWYIYTPNSPSTLVDVNGGGGISVTATNSCGTKKTGVTIYSNCGYNLISASPNPATDDVTISMNEEPAMLSSTTKSKLIYELRVADQLGNVKKYYKYPGVKSAKISLNGLIDGMYTIQVFDGNRWNSTKVIKGK